MGFMDKAKDALGDAKEQAEKLAAEHGDKVEGAIDKAKEMVTDRTPDNIDDKVEGAADKAKDLIKGLGDKGQGDA